VGHRHALDVAMAMFEDNARKINRMLAAINPDLQQDVIGLGQLDSMLRIKARLEQGAMVGMLADRTFGIDGTRAVGMLGGQADLPLGPFRMAAILRRPVVFMTALYMGGNRYAIHFEQLADFSDIPTGKRHQEIDRSMTRYAALVEKFCLHAPYNWFNFFNFWQSKPMAGDKEQQ